MSTVNRLFQFTFFAVTFFSLLLAWNSVGQPIGFADFRGHRFDQKHSDRSPAQAQTACSVRAMTHSSFIDVNSCEKEGGKSRRFIDTNEASPGFTATADYKRFPPQPQLN